MSDAILTDMISGAKFDHFSKVKKKSCTCKKLSYL